MGFESIPDCDLLRRGVYEHYKSTPKDKKEYFVLSVGGHTETDELLVVYWPLYEDPAHTGPRMQFRALEMFKQDVEIDGRKVSRFRYVRPFIEE